MRILRHTTAAEGGRPALRRRRFASAAAALALAALALLAMACGAAQVAEGDATLPSEMETQPIPDAEFALYLYFHSETPLNVARERFLPSDAPVPDGAPERVPLSKVSLVVSSLDEFAGTLGFPTDEDAQTAYDLYQRRPAEDPMLTELDENAVHLIRGDSLWAAGALEGFRDESLVTLEEAHPLGWSLLTNLPASEDSPPLAAGVMSMNGGLVQSVAARIGIESGGLDTAFGIVQVQTVAFGVYGDLPEETPPTGMDAAFFDETGLGVVMVSAAAYPGVAVAFLVRSIAGQLGMETIRLGETSDNARHLQVDEAHLIIKNKGSLVYATLAGTQERAESLMLNAMEERGDDG